MVCIDVSYLGTFDTSASFKNVEGFIKLPNISAKMFPEHDLLVNELYKAPPGG